MGTRPMNDQKIQKYIERQRAGGQKRDQASPAPDERSQQEISIYKALFRDLQQQPPVALSANFSARTISRIAAEQSLQPEPMLSYLALSAAFVGLAIFVGAYFFGLPSPAGIWRYLMSGIELFVPLLGYIKAAGLSMKLLGLGAVVLSVLRGLDMLLRASKSGRPSLLLFGP